MKIRSMQPEDIQALSEGFAAQGWQPRQEVWRRYLEEEAAGKRATFVAEIDGRAVGYVNLVYAPEHGPFAGSGLPEISDFNVIAPYRRQGVGKALMDAAEEAAARDYEAVTIGVGLHSCYGSAQRMYVKRGYIPDGSGVWYRDRLAAEGEAVANDDDLVLYLSKKLR